MWSWHPDADAKLAMMLRITPMTEAKEPGLRGERVISCKPSCRECRNVRRTCGDYTRVLLSLHTRPPVRKASGIPCASFLWGTRIGKARANHAAGMRNCGLRSGRVGKAPACPPSLSTPIGGGPGAIAPLPTLRGWQSSCPGRDAARSGAAQNRDLPTRKLGPSAPIPKFAGVCGAPMRTSESKSTSKTLDSSAVLNLKFL